MGQKIPNDILERATRQALGLEELDEKVLRERVSEIIVPERNILDFHFKDGTIKRIEWQNPSRSLSWTPEMREQARQRVLNRNRAKKGGKKYGSKSTNKRTS